MNWDDLKIILALNRTRSQTWAARSLRLNQSTVARRLNAIEADLGVILFTRSKAGFESTEAGDAAIRTAEEVERRMLRLSDEVDSHQRDLQGLVRIIANYWIVRHLLIPGMTEFCASHPEIELQLIGESRNRKVGPREAQLDIRFEKTSESGAIAIQLCRVPYAVYGPPDADPGDLGWLTFWEDESDYAPERWLKLRKQQRGHLRVRANDASLVLASIAAGLGKGLVPEIIAEREQRAKRISSEGHEIVRALYLLVNPDIMEVHRVKIAIRWLRALFADLFPDA